MVFSSPVFLFVFLPAVLLLSRVIPGLRGKNALLLAASLLFYGYGEPVYLLLLLVSILCNWAFGLYLGDSGRPMRRGILALAALVNLGMLGVFKYADFLLGTVNALFSAGLPLPGLALPVGISFFTFQGLSYVVDVYRDPAQVSKSPLKLGLYISFFPQLIAGPIVKYHDIEGQIDSRSCSPELTAQGIRRFIIGLSKKVLLANVVGRSADLIFRAEPSALSGLAAWLGAFCYLMQIYYDFSGYSDMAVGLGKMFGFSIQENFRHPYAADSMRDFWRRWHISLSEWFRDYLYIPLGGNRKGKGRAILNRAIVFFCTGLWHGASWNFVLWGLWHGLFVTLEGLLPDHKEKRPPLALRILRRAGVLLVVLLGFVLFRADTLTQAAAYYGKMFTGFAASPVSDALLRSAWSPYLGFSLLLCCVCAAPILPRFRAALAERGEASLRRWEIAGYAVCAGLFLLCVMSLAGSAYNPFIYFRF